MDNPKIASILVVDDAEEIRDLLQVALEVVGYEIRLAGDGVEALASVDDYPPDLRIVHINGLF